MLPLVFLCSLSTEGTDHSVDVLLGALACLLHGNHQPRNALKEAADMFLVMFRAAFREQTLV